MDDNFEHAPEAAEENLKNENTFLKMKLMLELDGRFETLKMTATCLRLWKMNF
jgi:hypothetical protein